MRFNNREMIHISHSNPVLEGRMSYAKLSNGYSSKGFKERWFRLKYNLLFYFKINGFGQVDLHQPAGVFVLENSFVRLENNMPGTLFSFSLSFKDEPDKKYIISSQSEDHVHQWIKCIQCSTLVIKNNDLIHFLIHPKEKYDEAFNLLLNDIYTYMQMQINILTSQLLFIGFDLFLLVSTSLSAYILRKEFIKLDPLLMYPEEGKKIGRTKRSAADGDDNDLFFNLPTDPLPPPRQKHDVCKTAELNLIEL
ncbi:hypothetical protein AGLY_011265 [Aphis glycines]|uniref:Pleckstrin homology domain-containing family J member 1 n=1 Tax=Aphis glycines TaxID=307491 RepID=A0A6G0TCY2_APHGL|nr:hypothetical protein AGLY_011265 [Aphis glycines]